MLMQNCFFAAYDCAEKADFNKGYWNPKRKLVIAGHLLEIIKQQLFWFFGLFLFCFYCFVSQIEALLSLKNARLPPIFFLNTKSTC